jgi:hypothetical protein
MSTRFNLEAYLFIAVAPSAHDHDVEHHYAVTDGPIP